MQPEEMASSGDESSEDIDIVGESGSVFLSGKLLHKLRSFLFSQSDLAMLLFVASQLCVFVV